MVFNYQSMGIHEAAQHALYLFIADMVNEPVHDHNVVRAHSYAAAGRVRTDESGVRLLTKEPAIIYPFRVTVNTHVFQSEAIRHKADLARTASEINHSQAACRIGRPKNSLKSLFNYLSPLGPMQGGQRKVEPNRRMTQCVHGFLRGGGQTR